MEKQVFHIWEKDERVTLTAYIDGDVKGKTAIIVLPGGAYYAISEKEADNVALHFAERGFAGFVLRYSTLYESFAEQGGAANKHTIFPEPLHQVAAAIRFVRENRDAFGVDGNKIALMGFSAGGHLAGNYGNLWAQPEIYGALGTSREEICPNANILCYAATELHPASVTMNRAVFGAAYKNDMLEKYCVKNYVNRHTPPTFLWHTVTDEMVPVSQSYRLARELDEEGIVYELHIFSSGPHAAGLSRGLPAEPWTELAESFLKRCL